MKKFYLVDSNIKDMKHLTEALKAIKFWDIQPGDIPYRIFKFVFENGDEIDNYVESNEKKLKKIISLDFYYGLLDIIADRLEGGSMLIDMYAEKGNIVFIKNARKDGNEWSTDTTETAASNGNLKLLIYLHENGCSWDEWTCYSAVVGGQLDCLKYAVENDCRINIQDCLEVSKNEEIKDYLLSL